MKVKEALNTKLSRQIPLWSMQIASRTLVKSFCSLSFGLPPLLAFQKLKKLILQHE